MLEALARYPRREAEPWRRVFAGAVDLSVAAAETEMAETGTASLSGYMFKILHGVPGG
jgi:hypothetical protein